MAAYNIIAADDQGVEEAFLIVQADNLEEAKLAAEQNAALLLMLDRKFVRVELAADAN